MRHRRHLRSKTGWTRERSKIANAAKARYRLERDVPDREPVMQPWHRFEFKVRDRQTGEASGWYELSSVRHATKQFAALRLLA